MTTVSGTNIDEIPDIIDTVVEHKADVFAFARYCPTGEEKDVGIEPMRYRQLLADCDRKFKEYEAAGCETYFNKKDHLWTLYEYETGEFRIPQNVEEGMIYGGCKLRELSSYDPAHGRHLCLPESAEQQSGQCIYRQDRGCLARPDGAVP